MSDCSEKVKIIKGEDRNFFVRITECPSNDAFDLTSVTAIKAIFKGATSNVSVDMASSEISIVAPAVNGKIEIKISDAKTALLKEGDNMPFEIEIDEGADKRIIQVTKMLNIVARI